MFGTLNTWGRKGYWMMFEPWMHLEWVLNYFLNRDLIGKGYWIRFRILTVLWEGFLISWGKASKWGFRYWMHGGMPNTESILQKGYRTFSNPKLHWIQGQHVRIWTLISLASWFHDLTRTFNSVKHTLAGTYWALEMSGDAIVASAGLLLYHTCTQIHRRSLMDALKKLAGTSDKFSPVHVWCGHWFFPGCGWYFLVVVVVGGVVVLVSVVEYWDR